MHSKRCQPRRIGRPALRSPNESGYFLIEYLIYIVLLAVVMGVAFGAFYRAFTNSRDLSRNAEDILRTLQAGELWRADIRQAAAPPRIMEEAGVIAFEIPTASNRLAYVFYERSVWRKEGDSPPKEILPRVKESRMIKDQREKVTSWRWEVELWTKKKAVRVRPLFTFQAVPLQQVL